MNQASEQGILNAQYNAAIEAQQTATAQRAPHVLLRPNLAKDGNKWSALYGDNIQVGVCGFGDTPAKAMEDFDKNWLNETISDRCSNCGRAVNDDGYSTDPDGACIHCNAD